MIDNYLTLIQTMAWHWTGEKPMMTHIIKTLVHASPGINELKNENFIYIIMIMRTKIFYIFSSLGIPIKMIIEIDISFGYSPEHLLNQIIISLQEKVKIPLLVWC